VAKASPAIASFGAGEWSPQMEGRVDQERYPTACHISQNMIALKQGPSTSRPGTAYVQPVKNSANRSWILPFEYSQTQAFLIEFGNLYVRFYTNHGPLLSTGNPAYNSGTSYVLGNQVVSGAITYYCLAPTTGNAPPNATYWYPMSPYNGSATVAIYEIPSPYAYADLTDSLGEFTLQFKQSGDVLYIAGGAASTVTAIGYAPYTLTRYANAPPDWQFAQYAPTDGPFTDPLPLTPGSEIALTVSNEQGYGITINAWGGNVFASTDVGRLVRIGSQLFNQIPWQTDVGWTAGQICTNNGNNYLALTSGTSGTSPPVHTAGSVVDGMGSSGIRWLYTDSNYGIAQITAYVSATQVTANVLKQFPQNTVGLTGSITAITNANPCVVTTSLGSSSIPAGVSIFITGVQGMTQINGNNQPVGAFLSAAVTGGPAVQIAGLDSTTYGTYTSGGTFVMNATTEWQLGAWSNTTEWPRAVDEFKDRLCWGGKHNVWGSVPGLYNSQTPDFFNVQTTDSAFNITVPGSDNIVWLSAAIILLVGTTGGEYGIDAANYSTSALGPSNIECLRQSQWRCRPITPLLVGTTVLYGQRAGRKIFAMDYNFYLNRYDSTDQNKSAYHITIGGLSGFAYQQEPWSILWGWRQDGTLLSYTFNREDAVTAWCRHNMGNGGIVESCAVIPAPDGLRDEAWFIVNRTINGQTVRTVEYMTKQYEGPQAGYAGDAQSSAWYVDCGVQSVAPGTTQITGLPAVMWGQTVSILADGGAQPQQVVPLSGTIQLAGSFTTVTVGFPYQSNLVPMRFEGGAAVGTAQGKIKNGTKLALRLVDTFGCQVSQLTDTNLVTGAYQNPLGLTTINPSNFEQVQMNLTSTVLDGPPPLQSGDFPVSLPESANSESDKSDYYILVQQNLPLPMTIVGLFPIYDVADP
jgi:hypothetical protein